MKVTKKCAITKFDLYTTPYKPDASVKLLANEVPAKLLHSVKEETLEASKWTVGF